jgi:plasmid stabilization system protein ParE
VSYFLHEGAEEDIAGALTFYTERAGSQVAKRFLAEVERVAEMLTANPDLGTPTTNWGALKQMWLYHFA